MRLTQLHNHWKSILKLIKGDGLPKLCGANDIEKLN